MKKIITSLFIGACLFATAANAAPISAQAHLSSSLTTTSSLSSNHWYTFSAQAGDLVSITVNRLEKQFDPALALFSGLVTDEYSSLSLVAFADDNIAELDGYRGPFADPKIAGYEVENAGDFSFNIFSFLSGESVDGLFDYQLTFDITSHDGETSSVTVSEPATFGVFGLAMAGFIGIRRRLALKA